MYALKEAWLARLTDLVKNVRCWAETLGWATKQIELTRSDSQSGKYKVPALLLQDQDVRILLEPIARSAPGARDGAILRPPPGAWPLHTPPISLREGRR